MRLTTMRARPESKRSAKIERRGNVSPRASARIAPESPEAWTQVVGLRKGSGNASTQSGDVASVGAVHDRELSAGRIARA